MLTAANFSRCSRRRAFRRRGVAVMWLILVLCAAIGLLCLILEIGNLWVARVQLENALSAAALAGVDEWGDTGLPANTLPSRQRAVDVAAANTVDCQPLILDLNYNPLNINENDDTNGELVFGALLGAMSPYTFDANSVPNCSPATVMFEIMKNDSGASVMDPTSTGQNDFIRVNYVAGPPNISIRTIQFTVPVLANPNQQPYFFGGLGPQQPVLSTVPADYSGVDVDPVAPGTWYCTAPPFMPPAAMNTNPNGDICIEMANQIIGGGVMVADMRFRTIVLNITDTAMTAGDFFRFGVAMRQFNPPALPPPVVQNNGESWWRAPVSVSVTFYNSITMTTSTTSTTFVDDGNPNNGRAIADLSGGATGRAAVTTRGTVAVTPICFQCLGLGPAAFNVSSKATAAYDCATGEVQLVRIANYLP